MKKRLISIFLALVLLCGAGVLAMAAVADTGFSDVSADAWYAEAISYVQEHSLISGTASTTFSPDQPADRGTLVTALYRQNGSPAIGEATRFPDVSTASGHSNAITWAVKGGIVGGYSDGRFGPLDPVTREQLATILWRAGGSPTSREGTPFADQATIAPYAVSAVQWAREMGLVSGKDGNQFDPKGHTTRGELATILYRWASDYTSVTPPTTEVATENDDNSMPTLDIQVGSKTFTATLLDNATTRALLTKLPLTVSMGELNGNEKFYFLPNGLPTNSKRPSTIHNGDLMLYGSDCLVLFYETFSSAFSYTTLGQVDNPVGLAEALGHSSVEVTFRANN